MSGDAVVTGATGALGSAIVACRSAGAMPRVASSSSRDVVYGGSWNFTRVMYPASAESSGASPNQSRSA